RGGDRAAGPIDRPRCARAQAALTSTYVPGASASAGSLPVPGMRASTSPPPWRFAQSFQNGHQEPGCCFAPASQSSGVAAFASLSQKQYLLAAGGLTTPAIWPDAARQNVVGPL